MFIYYGGKAGLHSGFPNVTFQTDKARALGLLKRSAKVDSEDQSLALSMLLPILTSGASMNEASLYIDDATRVCPELCADQIAVFNFKEKISVESAKWYTSAANKGYDFPERKKLFRQWAAYLQAKKWLCRRPLRRVEMNVAVQ